MKNLWPAFIAGATVALVGALVLSQSKPPEPPPPPPPPPPNLPPLPNIPGTLNKTQLAVKAGDRVVLNALPGVLVGSNITGLVVRVDVVRPLDFDGHTEDARLPMSLPLPGLPRSAVDGIVDDAPA